MSSYNRSPSWSGVSYLYNFLTTNESVGPYAVDTEIENLEIGDVIQLGDENSKFYHTLIVTKIIDFPSVENIYVSTHSYDSNRRALSTYSYQNIRYLHIIGVR